MGFGKFQWIQIIGFSTVLCILGAFASFQNVFNVEGGEFRCNLPENIERKWVLDKDDLSLAFVKAINLPVSVSNSFPLKMMKNWYQSVK